MGRKSSKEFEAKFARHMMQACGVTRTELRTYVRGKVADHGYECAIHGVVEQQLWRQVRWSALLAAIVTAAILFFTGHALPAEGERPGSKASPFAEIFGVPSWKVGLLALSLGAAALARIALSQTTRHIWVECRDKKTVVNRTDVHRLVCSAADAAAHDDAKWTANELWFASSSKYDVAAMNLARENAVRCFQAAASGAFVEIDLRPDDARTG